MSQTVDMRGILLANSSSPKRASNYPLGNRPASGLQLAAGHYQAVSAMTLIYPRPDGETNTKARHRVNYTGQAYRIPIGVHGGAYPYNFSISGAPAGMTIGQSLTLVSGRYVRGADYGIVNWPTSVAGTYTITVTVTDQLGASASVTWTLVVGTSGWQVMDPAAGSNGTGTLASPFNTLASVTSGNPLLIRAGTVDMNQKPLPLDQMARTWLPYNGESVTLQQAASSIGNNPGNGDFWFSGFTFNVPDARKTVNQYFRFEGASRSVFFENTFDYANTTYTFQSGVTENVCCIMWTDQGVAESSTSNGWYNLIHSNSFKNIVDRDMLLAYSTRFTVVENNSLQSCVLGANNFGHGFYFKINCSDIDLKCNYSIGTANTQKLARTDAYTGLFQMNRIQLSYNNYRYYGSDEGAIGFCHEFHSSGDDHYVFRNTLYASVTAGVYLRGMAAGDTVVLSNNVMVSGGTNTNGVRTDQFDGSVTNTNYVAGNTSAGIIDSNGYLINAFVSNKGTAGAEIL